MNKELVALLPAYNESENIKRLVERWECQSEALLQQFGLLLRIVLVNDGSTDDTEAICARLEKSHPSFSHISHGQNKGLGKALQTGIMHVIDAFPNCEYTAIMDCDNTHDPKYVISMVDKMKQSQGVDVVIASRYRNGSKVYGVPFYRLLISYAARFVYTLTLRVKNVRDYTCGYRLYTTKTLHQSQAAFNGNLIEEKGFACMVELLYKLHTLNATFSEVPFELHYEDKQGASKMHVARTTSSSLSLIRKLKKR